VCAVVAVSRERISSKKKGRRLHPRVSHQREEEEPPLLPWGIRGRGKKGEAFKSSPATQVPLSLLRPKEEGGKKKRHQLLPVLDTSGAGGRKGSEAHRGQGDGHAITEVSLSSTCSERGKEKKRRTIGASALSMFCPIGLRKGGKK